MESALNTCPKCESLCMIPIVYGKPGERLERAAARGLVELGGCIVEHSNPTHRCLECRAPWRLDADESRLLEMLRDGFAVIEKHQGSLAYAISAYGAACVAYGKASQGSVDSSEAFSAMMEAYARIDRKWSDFFLQTQQLASRNFFHGRDLDVYRPYG
jgi:hypothetical protein